MKVTYLKTINVIVCYDHAFEYRINNCAVNELRDAVEEQMWDHHFRVADVTDPDTGEILMTLEKDYQSFSLLLC